MEDVYVGLANHLKYLIMGYPFNDGLLERQKRRPCQRNGQIASPLYTAQEQG